MARSRVIKPEFWDDEKLATCSRDARLTFIGMWNQSDDFGVVKGNLKWLMNKIFPYDEIPVRKFESWVKELEKGSFIIKFSANGENYFNIKSFLVHQKVEKPSKTRNPEAPSRVGVGDQSGNSRGGLPDEYKQKQNSETETEVITAPAVPQTTNGVDYLDLLLEDYSEVYQEANGTPYKILKGKDRTAVSGILQFYKKQKPEADSEVARSDLRKFFKIILMTDFKDKFLNIKTLPRLNSNFNDYHQALKQLKNGNSINEIINAIS